MNKYVNIFYIRSRFFLISLFETRSRFVLFLLYLVFRDEIEHLLYNISDFEKGARNKTINSRGRARILDANSRETFRDREFSPMSAYSVDKNGVHRTTVCSVQLS